MCAAKFWDLAGAAKQYPKKAYQLDPAVPLPSRYRLHQNFPNPFNPATTLRYEVPTESHVVISIYNLLGQEVVTLVNEKKVAGYYQVTWNGRDDGGRQVSSGIYFALMRGEGFRKHKKLLLVR
ncbi:MAG: T9SS type A sorting domain-containing protein [Fidelibacterota bacterium]